MASGRQGSNHGAEGPTPGYHPDRSLGDPVGDYGRLLDAPGLSMTRDAMAAVAATMLDEQPPAPKPGGWNGTPPEQPDPADNPLIPAGYTYLGQFIDHDITFDATSSSERRNRVADLPNARTPAFDLDCVYGAGPEVHPHLYDSLGALVTRKTAVDDPKSFDLQRVGVSNLGEVTEADRADKVAIIGDPRNDENRIVAQVQLAMIDLHNHFRSLEATQGFEEARRLTRWHYQWVVLHDFLPRIVGPDIVADVLTHGPLLYRYPYKWANIPVEFSVAAYRFGHSMIRPDDYELQPGAEPRSVFGAADAPLNSHLGGSTALNNADKIDWRQFVQVGGHAPMPSRRIDQRLASSLLNLLPFEGDALERNLAFRNLRRGVTMGLPSGQAAARELIERLEEREGSDLAQLPASLKPTEINPTEVIETTTWAGINVKPVESPLWFYILREAELYGTPDGSKNEATADAAGRSGGGRLGPLGGRIVAEVFIGLLHADPRSFLSDEPAWQPSTELTREVEGQNVFDFAALLKAAGHLD